MIDNPNSSKSNAPNTDELSDNVIAIGDQNTMSINGGPQVCSMLSVENPKQKITLSIAPVEGQKPVSMTFDNGFKEMSNPEKFPFGPGGKGLSR